jgi:hypothetical protein
VPDATVVLNPWNVKRLVTWGVNVTGSVKSGWLSIK